MQTLLKTAVLGIASLTFVAAAVLPAQTTMAGNQQRLRLRADLGGSTFASGKADYRERSRGMTFIQRSRSRSKTPRRAARCPCSSTACSSA